jgi:transcriptional regulator with XRE-family HTH domain
MNLAQIGELIRDRRSFLRLRQEDLSEISGVTIKTIHLVEQGKGNPSFETLEKLASILGLEILVQVKQPKHG